LIVQYNESHAQCASLHIYIIQPSDINVKACRCDLLYRTIKKFSFLPFLERRKLNGDHDLMHCISSTVL